MRGALWYLYYIVYSLAKVARKEDRREIQNLCCVLGTNAVHEGSPPKPQPFMMAIHFQLPLPANTFIMHFGIFWFQQAHHKWVLVICIQGLLSPGVLQYRFESFLPPLW